MKRNHLRSQANEPRKYAVAPYNFIDFPGEWVARYAKAGDLPKHNSVDERLLSGSLTLEWEAVTPVFIGRGGEKPGETKQFFRNQDGYAIPGNTIRGMIRSHVMILGMGNYRDDIQDARFMFRDMASKNRRLKEQYAASLGLLGHARQARQQQLRGVLPEKLKAGFMEKRGNDYYIRPAKKDENGKQIFSLSEHKLRNMRLKDSRIRYMYKPETWRNYRPGMRIDRSFENRFEYTPYFLKVYFTLTSDRKNVQRIFTEDARHQPGAMAGWLMSSGFIGNKKRHYIILDEDTDAPEKRIRLEYVQDYRDDLNRKKFGGNKDLNKRYQFFHLPGRPGEKKPIFYVEDPHTGDIRYFGFTPHLRIFYDYNVYDGIPDEFRRGQKLDYAASLFGYIAKERGEKSYKSRLSFGDFQAMGNPRPTQTYALISGEPKATAYAMYLKQPDYMEKGEWKSYNDPDFRLRGMKRYWLKESVVSEQEEVKNKNLLSVIQPLPAGTRFKGTIRFHNLHEDELGLLLWSIMLEPSSIVQAGMGKPYGFGQMRLDRNSIKLEIEEIDRKYSDRFTFRSQYTNKVDPDHYVDIYKKFMDSTFGIEIDQQSHIRDFLEMTKRKFPAEETRYMTLKEFRSLPALPTVEEFLNMPKDKR